MRAEEIALSVPDGRSVTTLINATPIHADDGAVASVVVTLQDLAPLRELERMRAEFLGMVSHELRTPLAAIKGSAATVLGASRIFGPAEVQQFFRIIDRQADRMDGLIGDLLDAGRIETGTLSVAPEPTQVAALVDQARNTFVSGGARHTLLIDLAPDLPQVMADRQRIVQVLNNLLSNAARHSPESAPIRVSAAHDGMHVAVSVADRGRGLAPERLGHLFRKYAHAGEGGLGLAICKGLVEAYGGRIRAESGGAGLGARGPGLDPRVPAAPGLGRTRQRRSQCRARLRQAAAPQAGRRRGRSGRDRQRARGRLPHAPAASRGAVPAVRRRCPRYTQPTPDHQLLLRQLNLQLPEQPPPRISP